MKHVFALIFCLLCNAGLFGQTTIHSRVLFDFGKYDLKHEALDTLNELTRNIPANTKAGIYLYGHTDWVGSYEYNYWLGRQRVEKVKNYFEAKGYKVILASESYGKAQPQAPNTSETGRKQNRRVEIEIRMPEDLNKKLTSKINEAKKDSEIEIIPEPILPVSDGMITLQKGTKLDIHADVVAPHDMNKVKFEVQEILTAEDMIKYHATTQDKDGQRLISGGMVVISATIDGKEISANKPYTVYLPVEEYAIDSEMELFVSEKKNGYLVWKYTKIPVKVVQKDDKFYYQFTVSTFGGFNCDKYRKSAYKNSRKVKLFTEKIRIQTYYISDAYLYDKKNKEMIFPASFNRKMVKFKNIEHVYNRNYRLYVSAYKNEKLYFANVPLNGLDYRLFINGYRIPEYRFRPVTQKQLDKYFASR